MFLFSHSLSPLIFGYLDSDGRSETAEMNKYLINTTCQGAPVNPVTVTHFL